MYPSGMLTSRMPRRARVLERSGFAAVAAAQTGPGGRSAFSAPIRRGPRPMLQARGRSPGNEVGAADGAATSRKERFPPPCRRTAVGRFRSGALATAAAVQPRREENVPRKAWGLVRAVPAGLLMRTRPPLWWSVACSPRLATRCGARFARFASWETPWPSRALESLRSLARLSRKSSRRLGPLWSGWRGPRRQM